MKTLSAKFNKMEKSGGKQEPRKTAIKPSKSERAADIESQAYHDPGRIFFDGKPCAVQDAFEGTGYELLQSLQKVDDHKGDVPHHAEGCYTTCISEGISHTLPNDPSDNVYHTLDVNSATGNGEANDRLSAGRRIMKTIGMRFSSFRGIRKIRGKAGAHKKRAKSENDAACEGPIYHEPDALDSNMKNCIQDAFEGHGYDLIQAPGRVGNCTPHGGAIGRSRSCPAPNVIQEDESGYALVSIGKP